jgi:hypothetical protein
MTHYMRNGFIMMRMDRFIKIIVQSEKDFLGLQMLILKGIRMENQ